MGRWFGTDGVRGVANQDPITADFAVRMGQAIACQVREYTDKKSAIVVGRDTRISGPMLEHALAAGICSMGVDVILTGVLPTPGIAYLTRTAGARMGVVISASHNPFYDNGIKLFDEKGFKLSDDRENWIEALIREEKMVQKATDIQRLGQVRIDPEAGLQYAGFLKQCVPPDVDFSGKKIGIDCANGATYQVARKVLYELGVEVIDLFCDPDGININQECGSQHPGILAERVCAEKADLGLAFDGDGDRLIVVDEKGAVATGDRILAACAISMKEEGHLQNNLLVTTIMSNIGLGLVLQQHGIEHVRAGVGDRYVMEKMHQHKAVIGGEDSGHMIFLDQHTTGDGLLAALRLMTAIHRSQKRPSELLSQMTVFPQKLINITVREKPDIHTVPRVKEVIQTVEAELGSQGRVLVRYSGTQPMCRVMVEGPTESQTELFCRKIADVVEAVLG